MFARRPVEKKVISDMATYTVVTGGCGYIGSHTVLALIRTGHHVIVIDNLCNSSIDVLSRIEDIAETKNRIVFYRCDIRDGAQLLKIFSNHKIRSVVHFAGLKAVGESVANPLLYYDNNVAGTLSLLQAMVQSGIHRIVFSSSATVYKQSDNRQGLAEGDALGPSNPYGNTKLAIETMIREMVHSYAKWRAVILRYFNPIGADESGLIGEDPDGVPNNLMPFIAQTAVGKRPHLTIFGKDYDTRDGTAVRDYIHVTDLARAHVAAIAKLDRDHQALNKTGAEPTKSRVHTYNLGTGKGYSVQEVVRAFGRASGIAIPYKIGPRRAGDLPFVVANPSFAARLEELNWRAEHDMERMCTDHWRWQDQNPNGYKN